MVARLEAFDTRAHLNHNTGAFVAQNRRENPFRIITAEGKGIGVANAAGLDLNQHLPLFGAGQIHFYNFQGFSCLKGNRSACFHGALSVLTMGLAYYSPFISE